MTAFFKQNILLSLLTHIDAIDKYAKTFKILCFELYLKELSTYDVIYLKKNLKSLHILHVRGEVRMTTFTSDNTCHIGGNNHASKTHLKREFDR